MGKMAGSATSIITAGAMGGPAFAAAAATVAAAAAAKQHVGNIDKLANTAQKLGMATENLEALRMAGRLAGVEITTTDMAIQRFTRRASEAAKGDWRSEGGDQRAWPQRQAACGIIAL